MLQLYAGHWDAVSVVASAGNTTAPAAEVHRAALCGRPLVLNAFGAPLLAAGQPCVDGWVSAVDGSCLEGAEAAKVSHASAEATASFAPVDIDSTSVVS